MEIKKNRKQRQKDRREQRGTETIMKEWELNDFVVHFILEQR